MAVLGRYMVKVQVKALNSNGTFNANPNRAQKSI